MPVTNFNPQIRMCPICGDEIVYVVYFNWWRAKKENRMCKKCAFLHRKKTTFFKKGHPNLCVKPESLKKISEFHRKRYADPEERKKTSEIMKLVMHKPDIRRKHLNALHQSKWIKVKTDKGQIELIEKWNRLGFNFELNYQLKIDENLFYLDGYDKERNVVLEYDSKYHNKIYQKQKDLIRQEKIVSILSPKKFWRYNSVEKVFKNILEGRS